MKKKWRIVKPMMPRKKPKRPEIVHLLVGERVLDRECSPSVRVLVHVVSKPFRTLKGAKRHACECYEEYREEWPRSAKWQKEENGSWVCYVGDFVWRITEEAVQN